MSNEEMKIEKKEIYVLPCLEDAFNLTSYFGQEAYKDKDMNAGKLVTECIRALSFLNSSFIKLMENHMTTNPLDETLH